MYLVLTFLYQVRDGDNTTALDVKGIDFQMGIIFNPLTGAEVSQDVPSPGANTRAMSQAAVSLSYTVDIIIKTSNPAVILVSSPNPNGVYTLGDIVTIYVTFDIPIKVYNSGNLILKLPVGSFVRSAIYSGILPDKLTLIFKYTILVKGYLKYFMSMNIIYFTPLLYVSPQTSRVT
jgi:hypothetical protein